MKRITLKLEFNEDEIKMVKQALEDHVQQIIETANNDMDHLSPEEAFVMGREIGTANNILMEIERTLSLWIS